MTPRLGPIKIFGLTAALLLMSSAAASQNDSGSQPILFPVSVPDKGTGFIDQSGHIVIEPRFTGSMYGIRFSEGLAPVKFGHGWAYIDAKGNTAFTVPGAREAANFSEGLAGIAVAAASSDPAAEKLKWGFIDKTGKIVIKPQFDEQYGFSEGLGRVVENGLWGFIDRQGKFVIEPQFRSAYWFAEGFASVRLANDKNVYVDHLGRIASPRKYLFTDAWFNEGLTEFYLNDKCGYVNKHWEVVIEPKFDRCAQTFSDGVAAVRVGDHWGVIEKTGKFVIEPKLEQVPFFSEGLAPVRIDGKLGYIDKSGAIVIEPRFAEAGEFHGGLAAVTRNPDVRLVQCCWPYWDYIDKTGKFVWRSPH